MKTLFSAATGLLIVLAGLAGTSVPLAAQAPEGLFLPLPAGQAPDLADDGRTIRARAARIDTLQMATMPDGSGAQPRVVLNLFDDVVRTATLQRVDRVERTGNGYVWVGRLDGVDLSAVTLAYVDGVMYGTILSPREQYAIRPIGGGNYVIAQLDQSAFPHGAPAVTPPLGVAGEPAPAPAALPRGGASTVEQADLVAGDDGSTIDIMVLYTPAAAAAATGGIGAVVANSISVSNTTFANSGVTTRLRLVHSGQVAYTEAGGATGIETDLGRLQSGAGALSGVAALRNTYRADLVALLTNTPGTIYCGIGYRQTLVDPAFAAYAFTVSEQWCAADYLTMPHEIGHNMGADHDWYVSQSVYPSTYAHGYVNATPGQRWRTVMSYSDLCSDQGFYCAQIPYWANPTLTYQGAAMGVASGTRSSADCYHNLANPACDADDRLTLNTTAPTVANFRQAIVPLQVTALTASRAAPIPLFSDVTWTATATGGTAPYTYKFVVFNGSSWSVGQDWSSTNTWQWTPAQSGDHAVQVWVRSAGSVATYDAWLGASTSVTFPLRVTSVTPNNASAPAGSTVVWTAQTSGGYGAKTYKFFVYDGAMWRVARDWQASNAFAWTPSEAGTYAFQAWARNDGSSAAYDAWLPFGPYSVRPPTTLTVTGIEPGLLSPVPAGTPVKWTARALGGTPPYTYKFYVFNGSTWSVGQDWSASNAWIWTPPAAGQYGLQVWVRSAGSAATYDAWGAWSPFVVSAPAALSVTSFTADRVGAVAAGTPVVFTTAARGGTGPYTYKYYVYNGSSWSVAQDWTASSTWTWVPPAPGSYSFQVWVRNAASAATYDAWLGGAPMTVTASEPLSIARATIAPGSPLFVGAPATVDVTGSGGTGPYTYKFFVYNGASWSVAQDWSAASSLSWTPPAAGAYTFQIWVRNQGSAATYDAYVQLAPVTVTP